VYFVVSLYINKLIIYDDIFLLFLLLGYVIIRALGLVNIDILPYCLIVGTQMTAELD